MKTTKKLPVQLTEDELRDRMRIVEEITLPTVTTEQRDAAAWARGEGVDLVAIANEACND